MKFYKKLYGHQNLNGCFSKRTFFDFWTFFKRAPHSKYKYSNKIHMWDERYSINYSIQYLGHNIFPVLI